MSQETFRYISNRLVLNLQREAIIMRLPLSVPQKAVIGSADLPTASDRRWGLALRVGRSTAKCEVMEVTFYILAPLENQPDLEEVLERCWPEPGF
jgi:hypothetical protein